MIKVTTDNPAKLIDEIVGAISINSIPAWVEEPVSYFTFASEQWKFKAWFVPRAVKNKVVFNIVRPKDGNIDKITYAIYHSKFLELLLIHFDDRMKFINVSSLAAEGDAV